MNKDNKKATDKVAFLSLLNKAVRTPPAKVGEKDAQKKSDDSNAKRVHRDTSASA